MRAARSFAIASVLAVALAGPAWAKTTKLWNLTAYTITSIELAPAGSGKYGQDLAKLDPDGSVDHDERIKLGNVADGSYDVRVKDDHGRTCVVKGVAIKDGDIVAIEEKQLEGCAK
jgi:hypothetical protein